jgi:hypothetical protein
VSGPIFSAPGLVFGGIEGVESRFHVLCSRNCLRRYRRRWDPFSSFARSDSFLALPRVSHPVFMFSTPGHVFGGTEGRRVPFSCFARPDSFSAVPRASCPVFIFYTPDLVFGGVDGAEGVGTRFHVLRARTQFRRSLGRRVPFLCFALPDSFSTVPRASGPVFILSLSDSFSSVPRASHPIFMFPALGHVFSGTEGVRYLFHVLHSRTRFRRYRERLVSFSCFPRPKSFSAVPWASGPVFKFCTPEIIFGGTEGVGSRFHVLRARTRFRRYHGRRVPFSCFALCDSFSAVPRASSPVFMFCSPGLVFDGAEGVGSRFHFCALGLVFIGNKGVPSRFHVSRSRTCF